MIAHPSLMLIASLDEREHNAESAADVRRAFCHLGPTTVRAHAASDPACNVLQLKVNFSKKYWCAADEGADEMWPQVREWLAGKRYFVGENIKSFNKTRGERGEQTVDYRRLDLLMAGNTVHVAVEPGCDLPVFEDMAERLRALVNAGVLGKEGAPVEVFVPSEESLAAQRAAWQEAQAAEAKAEAGSEPAEQPAGQAEGDGAAEQAAEPAQDAAAPLAIDYGVWGVVEDGAQRAFDAAQGAWL